MSLWTAFARCFSPDVFPSGPIIGWLPYENIKQLQNMPGSSVLVTIEDGDNDTCYLQ